MGKHGPCYHCGVTSTPLWRNGPPDKPILCNACGSRWRTKGSLLNYTPLHARASIENMETFKTPMEKSIIFKHKLQTPHKTKQSYSNIHIKHEMVDYDQNFHRVHDEDFSNRSSSGSAVSYSESCAHFGNADLNDVAGSLQSNVWESLVPSKKRTGVTRQKPSSVEKLTKGLHFIMHQQSSYFSGLSEENLLYENDTPNGSVEISNGGILIRQSNLSTLEEESEASSLLVENKSIYSELPISVHVHNKETNLSNMEREKFRKTSIVPEYGKRDKSRDNFKILKNSDSQLGFIDLNEVVNLDTFMGQFTNEEQQNLLKYLPSSDSAKAPESLRSMFASTQFQEALVFYQMLLQQGVFGPSFPGDSNAECRSLRNHALFDLAKSTWIEYSKNLKDTLYKRHIGEQKEIGAFYTDYSSKLVSLKRTRDGENQNFQEMKKVIKSPKKVRKSGPIALASLKTPNLDPTDIETQSNPVNNEHTESDDSCFSARNLCVYNSDKSSILDSLQFNDAKTDADLLLDICSSSSFPEAELLSDIWKLKNTAKSSSTENGASEKDVLSCHPSSSSSNKQSAGSIHV